jgi:cell wall-associated NlpC family hydrolase
MYHSMFNAMNTGRQSLVNPAVSGILQTSPGRNATTLRKPGIDNAPQRSHPQQTQLAAVRNLSDTTNPVRFPRFPNENQSTASEQQNLKPAGTGFTPTKMADVVVADGSSVTSKCFLISLTNGIFKIQRMSLKAANIQQLY